LVSRQVSLGGRRMGTWWTDRPTQVFAARFCDLPNKKRENNPMHSSRVLWDQGLTAQLFAVRRKTRRLTRRAKHLHHGIIPPLLNSSRR
jgi:hypothetical protein